MRQTLGLAVAALVIFTSAGCGTPAITGLPVLTASGAGGTATDLAPGLRYERGDTGEATGPVRWLLSLGVIRNPAEDRHASECATQLGLSPRLEQFVFLGTHPEPYTEMVLGDFRSRSDAQSYLDGHTLDPSCVPEIKGSGLYPTDDAAPFVVHVLRLDPGQFAGRLIVARGNAVATGRTRPSVVLESENGLAATNGGFFVVEPGDGVVGESTGISVIAGALQSEPTNGRPWALIENGPSVRVSFHAGEAVRSPSLVVSDGRAIALDGINREPGLLRNCGALNDDAFAVAIHDHTCRPENEIVVVGADSGFDIRASDSRAVYRFQQDGPLLPAGDDPLLQPGETFVVATGTRRAELSQLAASRLPLRLEGDRSIGDSQAFALNGGPMLLSRGQVVARADIEGWPFAASPLDQANAMHRFISLRAPRTALGVTSSGQILLVVVDGWRYRSDQSPTIPMNGGASIAELAGLMRELGAEDAINLDGGGSSVMALRAGVVSHPSDDDGERAVGDTLVLLPSRR